MLDELRRIAMFTSGVAELTRHRAEQIVRGWVSDGDVKRDHASAMVRNLVETSRASRAELLRFVRDEIRAQVEGLGLASRRDVERLERRVARLEAAKKEQPGPSKRTSAKKGRASAKKTGGARAATKTTAGRTAGSGAARTAGASKTEPGPAERS